MKYLFAWGDIENHDLSHPSTYFWFPPFYFFFHSFFLPNTSSQSFQACQKSDYSHVNWDVIEKRFEEQKCLLAARKSRTCPFYFWYKSCIKIYTDLCYKGKSNHVKMQLFCSRNILNDPILSAIAITGFLNTRQNSCFAAILQSCY